MDRDLNRLRFPPCSASEQGCDPQTLAAGRQVGSPLAAVCLRLSTGQLRSRAARATSTSATSSVVTRPHLKSSPHPARLASQSATPIALTWVQARPGRRTLDMSTAPPTRAAGCGPLNRRLSARCPLLCDGIDGSTRWERGQGHPRPAPAPPPEPPAGCLELLEPVPSIYHNI